MADKATETRTRTIVADRVSSRTIRPPARHLIVDVHQGAEGVYETVDGLAFTVGVACVEAEITRDPTRMYKVQHPNGVDIYHVVYIPSGQVVVTKVGT